MNRRSFIATAFIGCQLAAAVPAGEFLVRSPSGFAEALERVRPGDVVVAADGEWRDADLLFRAAGTAEQPITLRAETPGRVVLTGDSRLRIAGEHLVVDGLWFNEATPASGHLIAFRSDPRVPARHCRLTNCAVTDSNPPDRDADTKWVSLFGTHNRVDRCYFKGKQNAGPTLVVWLSDQPNHHRIDHNHFGPRPPLGKNGGETIRVGTSDWSLHDSHTVVEHNLFEECNGEIEIISSKSCRNTYRRNTFLRSAGALTLRHGNACLVEGNFFLGEGRRNTGGVRIIGEDHQVINNYFAGLRGDSGRAAISLMNGVPDSPLAGYFQVQRATVAFNTLVDCRHPLVIGLTGSRATLPPRDVRIANNILVGSGDPLVKVQTPPLNVMWQSNLLHGAAPGIAPTDGLRLADPRLAEADDGLYRPAADSPAIDAAAASFGVAEDVLEDIDGQPRGSLRDIGCDEHSDAPIRFRPLRAADVGPSWLER